MKLQEKEQLRGSFLTDRAKNLIAHVAIYLLLSYMRMVLIKMQQKLFIVIFVIDHKKLKKLLC